jgi:signal transduction histidine kinase
VSGGERAALRAYRRLGSRLLIACQAVNLVAGFVFTYMFVLGYLRFTKADTSKIIDVTALWTVELVAAWCVANIGISRRARPLTQWLDGERTIDGARAAWEAGVRLPTITGAWYLGALSAEAPANTYLVGRVDSYGGGIYVALGMTAIAAVGVALLAAGAMLSTRITVRSMLLDVDAVLSPDTPPPRGGLTVRSRLVLLTPAMFFIPLVAGLVIAMPRDAGTGHGVALFVLGTGIAAAFGVPFALLLATATLQPLEDLLAAAERLRDGDLSTRVPAISSDEHGEIARAFNDAFAGLAERQRLAERNTELLAEVQASRARIIAASDAERNRIQRNLHDGAQQRLVALGLDLRVLEDKAAVAPQLQPDIERARAAVKAALDELRELARGVHPAVLSTDGLRPAIRSLAGRCNTPVVADIPDRRLPPSIESTIYFLVSEAVANVDKHAGATRIEVHVHPDADRVVVNVRDDGNGGADPSRGTGLTGLADRVAAAGGTLTIDSPPGQGTRLHAEVPLSGQATEIRTGTDSQSDAIP